VPYWHKDPSCPITATLVKYLPNLISEETIFVACKPRNYQVVTLLDWLPVLHPE
jgi:hypothetical protein